MLEILKVALYYATCDQHSVKKGLKSKEEWLYCARKTAERWQFPNCIGAADGKHISVLHPFGSGTAYYNYKCYFSIVLLALVDFNYKFLFVDVGCREALVICGVYRK